MPEVCKTISGIIIQICPLAMIRSDFDYDLGLCLCKGDWFDEMNKVCYLKYMRCLPSSRVCHGNFSKHTKCFGRILGVKPSVVDRQIFTPEFSRSTRNISESIHGIRSWKGGLTCISSHISFHFVDSIPPHKQDKIKQYHTRHERIGIIIPCLYKPLTFSLLLVAVMIAS